MNSKTLEVLSDGMCLLQVDVKVEDCLWYAILDCDLWSELLDGFRTIPQCELLESFLNRKMESRIYE